MKESPSRIRIEKLVAKRNLLIGTIEDRKDYRCWMEVGTQGDTVKLFQNSSMEIIAMLFTARYLYFRALIKC